jgi:serine/threonine-protein kinase
MSVVWRARDEVLDRLVAVKWLGADLAEDTLFRDLVRREAWATARIKHPAVAAVYDYGEIAPGDGRVQAYVVMEMLDGEPLSARLRRGPMPWREAVAIGAEVADALATAHEHGVVHRDVSPDNVMLTSSGLRVFDFGIAAAVGEPDDDATGSTFGTPAYVAPERLDGQPAHTATDVYCLGVLLFEMLTGDPPFPEDTWDPEAPLRERPLPRPRGVSGLPSAVARLCQRCLAFDPAARPPAREVATPAGRLRPAPLARARRHRGRRRRRTGHRRGRLRHATRRRRPGTRRGRRPGFVYIGQFPEYVSRPADRPRYDHAGRPVPDHGPVHPPGRGRAIHLDPRPGDAGRASGRSGADVGADRHQRRRLHRRPGRGHRPGPAQLGE